jgi:hypothetical protein
MTRGKAKEAWNKHGVQAVLAMIILIGGAWTVVKNAQADFKKVSREQLGITLIEDALTRDRELAVKDRVSIQANTERSHRLEQAMLRLEPDVKDLIRQQNQLQGKMDAISDVQQEILGEIRNRNSL